MTTKKKMSTKKASVSVSSTEIVATTEAGKVEVLQMKPSADILDMKLTRSELIDLITEEVEADLRSQLRKAKKELDGVTDEIVAYFNNMSDDDLINNLIMPEIRKSLEGRRELSAGNLYYNRDNSVSFGHVYMTAKVPQTFVDRQTELNKTINDLQQKMQKLSSKAGKLEIMKQMLATSEEGQKLLAQIQGFKRSASVKLLGA